MNKTPSLAIGIITYKRKKQTLSLIKEISKQLNGNDKIILVENGSSLIKNADLIPISSKKIIYIHSKDKSIPSSRNIIFQTIKNDFDLLAYIDSDCIPSIEWVKDIKKDFDEKNSFSVIQGKIASKPLDNLYAQTSQLLFELWQDVNSKKSTTKILDTKNIFFKLSKFRKKNDLFDESLKFASDIDLGYRLQKEGFKIKRSQNALVFHFERISLKRFIKHRLRISISYRSVLEKYPNFFKSALPIKKIIYLYKNLHFPIYKKIWIITVLHLIYIISFINIRLLKLKKILFG